MPIAQEPHYNLQIEIHQLNDLGFPRSNWILQTGDSRNSSEGGGFQIRALESTMFSLKISQENPQTYCVLRLFVMKRRL